jgi:NAD(P)-dependent dehydrogenase (short-subunit alcohol dehydrogenase family)
MELKPGQVAVVTGAASGIGLALSLRFAQAGMRVMMADIEAEPLAAAAASVEALGVEVETWLGDVSKEANVQALAAATLARFGGVHVVCNNAGVAARSDPWFGPLSSWEWVMGVNFWGVVHGCRAFLPHLLGGGHIVNTASMAGLMPGFGPSYDASKHAVVALTEDLFLAMNGASLPVGVSVLCPGWVRTRIVDSDRNWPTELGVAPQADVINQIVGGHVRRAIEEGITPAFVADKVFEAVSTGQFWVIPQQEFLDLAVDRWGAISERANPRQAAQVPGMPPRAQITAEVMAALGLTPPAS